LTPSLLSILLDTVHVFWERTHPLTPALLSILLLEPMRNCRPRNLSTSHCSPPILIKLIGWLSPELYLRRPPSRNEQYRLDRMLQAAAQRGVKVNIIVYKEVTQALTRKYLSRTLPDYLHSLLPRSTDVVTKSLAALGLAATFASLEHVEKENPLISLPLTVCSFHTKHALEDLHPNISVFRHPDHLPDAQTLQSSFFSSLQHLSLSAKTLSELPADGLKAIYGMNEDVILYWAHHEKLCLIDGNVAFMGGLDLCYGRWDTNQHPLADCHPSNLDDIVFPGQDYNNARYAVVCNFNPSKAKAFSGSWISKMFPTGRTTS